MSDFHNEQSLQPVNNGGYEWPEARCFERLYGRNPHAQARLAKALIGFRHYTEQMNDEDTVEALDVVLSAFAKYFPEFLTPLTIEDQDSDIFREDYVPEDRMLWFLAETAIIDD